jgi:hypothetical protein
MWTIVIGLCTEAFDMSRPVASKVNSGRLAVQHLDEECASTCHSRIIGCFFPRASPSTWR